MTTCELRLKAAQIIEERGWCQKWPSMPTGEVCMVGALCAAREGEADWKNSDTAIALRIKATGEMGFDVSRKAAEMVEWNDASGRTKEEIVARLRDGCVESK